MKFKVMIVLFVGVIALCGCGKEEAPNETPKEEVSHITDKHYAVLDSTKMYEDLDNSETLAAIELLDSYWDELSAEDQEKYASRKEELEKSRSEYYASLMEQRELEKQIEENKTQLKFQVETELDGYTLNSVDILTSTADNSPIISIQVNPGILKENATFEFLNNFCDGILNKISSLADEIWIDFVDSNYQLIASYSDGNLELR